MSEQKNLSQAQLSVATLATVAISGAVQLAVATKTPEDGKQIDTLIEGGAGVILSISVCGARVALRLAIDAPGAEPLMEICTTIDLTLARAGKQIFDAAQAAKGEYLDSKKLN